MWQVRLGGLLAGYDAEAIVASAEEVSKWLRANAVQLYSDSAFARLYRDPANDP